MKYRYSTRPMARERRRIKAAVFHRDNGACFWCDRDLSFAESTLDHIITASRGGAFAVGNLVLACLSCNGRRSDMTAVAFLRQQIGRGGAL